MREALEKVAAFQRAFFIKTGYWPADIGQQFISENETAIRLEALINEESTEVSDILLGIDEDLSDAHLLKEGCDLLYVTYAMLVTYYDIDVIEEAFNRVADNVMLKVDTGTVDKNGKLVKIKNHPKVDLRDLTGELECLVCHDDPKECEGATICPWAATIL